MLPKSAFSWIAPDTVSMAVHPCQLFLCAFTDARHVVSLAASSIGWWKWTVQSCWQPAVHLCSPCSCPLTSQVSWPSAFRASHVRSHRWKLGAIPFNPPTAERLVVWRWTVHSCWQPAVHLCGPCSRPRPRSSTKATISRAFQPPFLSDGRSISKVAGEAAANAGTVERPNRAVRQEAAVARYCPI